MAEKQSRWLRGVLAVTCAVATVWVARSAQRLEAEALRAAANVRPAGQGRLIGYEPLGSSCLMPAAAQRRAGAPTSLRDTAFMSPARQIKDPYPSFASVSVDPERNEVVFTDESLFQVLIYDRLENTPAAAAPSRPKRVIAGEHTDIEFQSGVWVDPANGEIFAVNNDTRDTTVVFPPNAAGDVTPIRSIKTAHGTFGLVSADPHDEVLIAVQHDSALIAYRKTAGKGDSPLRFVQGGKTRMADPHGMAYDVRDDVVFVANYGSAHLTRRTRTPRAGVFGAGQAREAQLNWPAGPEWAIPGSGTISGPSITVYRRTASGDIPPLRVIEGPAAQLNWPTGLAFDPSRRELYVANDMGPSILVFDAEATGNAAPKRVLKGARTGLANPTGVAVDPRNRELWVANFGGHSATVYDLDATGDTPPKRTIRNAPPDAPSLMIGNPGAVAYDSKREQLLVPN